MLPGGAVGDGELVAELRKGPDPENPSRSDSLREAYYALYEEQAKMDSVYVEENPSSFATVLVLRGSFYTLDVEELEAARDRIREQGSRALLRENLEAEIS